MALLLRVVGAASAVISLLVFASILVGQMSDMEIWTGNLEVEGQTYILYVEDSTHVVRVPLAGTRCFKALPDWVSPEEEPAQSSALDYSRFFMEQIHLMDLLVHCQAPTLSGSAFGLVRDMSDEPSTR